MGGTKSEAAGTHDGVLLGFVPRGLYSGTSNFNF